MDRDLDTLETRAAVYERHDDLVYQALAWAISESAQALDGHPVPALFRAEHLVAIVAARRGRTLSVPEVATACARVPEIICARGRWNRAMVSWTTRQEVRRAHARRTQLRKKIVAA